MFALISNMEMEPSAMTAEQLAHMVAVVSGSAGFRQGYWARDVDDQRIIHAVVMFDGVEEARDFARGIAENVPSAKIRIVEIIANA